MLPHTLYSLMSAEKGSLFCSLNLFQLTDKNGVCKEAPPLAALRRAQTPPAGAEGNLGFPGGNGAAAFFAPCVLYLFPA